MKTPAIFSGLSTRMDTKSGDCRVVFTFTCMESPSGAQLVMAQFAPLAGLEVILNVTRRQLSLIPDTEGVDLKTGEVSS